jgi:hypothetical protein
VKAWVLIIIVSSKIFGYLSEDDLYGITLLCFVTPNFIFVVNFYVNSSWKTAMSIEKFSDLIQFEHLIRAKIQGQLAKDETESRKIEMTGSMNDAIRAAYEHDISKTARFYISLAYLMLRVNNTNFAKVLFGNMS